MEYSSISAEQGSLRRQHKATLGGLILLTLVLCLLPFFASSYLLTIMITSLHLVYLAQSWNLLFGYTGQLALGHGVFYGIAGYFSTKLFLSAHVTPYLGGILGGLILGWLRRRESSIVAPFVAHGLFWMMGAFMVIPS